MVSLVCQSHSTEDRKCCCTSNVHGHQLKNVDHVKYLGINITSDLRWDKHVDVICNKANSALGFIGRNVNIGNTKVKALA